MKYEKLLDDALKKLPEVTLNKERFEMPKAKGHIQGNKTIISNFIQIADYIGRSREHLLKYILKELATPGEIKKEFFIIGSKVSASRINEKISRYVQEFVICSECGKPDTKIVKDGNILFLKCQACGATHPIKSKI